MKKYILVLFLSMLCSLSFSKGIELKTPGNIIPATTISLSGDDWRIAIDSENTGRQQSWFKTPPVAGSRQTPVPWVIQDIFHDYHGVVWYWRQFDTPENLHTGGRYLLKFHAVDYLADVWVNGKHAGVHEGGETPFNMDVTDFLNSKGKNLLVVRVLNPTYEPIDGISLKDTPSGPKNYPICSNSCYNSGGIIGDVELLVVPAVRISDLYITADWKTGKVKVQAIVLNSYQDGLSSSISFKVSEVRTGTLVAFNKYTQNLKMGSNTVVAEIQVAEHKLWSPDDPVLYRAEASAEALTSMDDHSVRFGFRDFRFENGYFRLNGKRIFLKGANIMWQNPVGYTVPLYEDLLRRDVVNLKALGFNFVRIPFGCPQYRVLDIYDELGILVMQEHYGSWQMGQYGGYKFPQPDNWEDLLLARFENSIQGVILRDRNHASVVMWDLLNENKDDRLFRKAVDLLPALRTLDPSRLFILNSGRFDRVKEIGSMSNPGSMTWDIGFDELYDWHPYKDIPFSPGTLDELSGRSGISDQKFFITEAGLCSPVNLPSELGDYQQWGKEQSDDALYFKRQYEKFLADWTNFNLGDIWSRTEDYINNAYITANSLREILETAIRTNPFIISYMPTTASRADLYGGEGVWTNFRRLKHELIGSVLLANSSLRWCISTEPQSIYRGDRIQLRVSFSNLDVLNPGKYPATIQVFDPDMKSVYDKKVIVNIAETKDGKELPFAQTVLKEDITINGPAGKYQFLARLDHGGTAMGGKEEFYVSDVADLPKIPKEVVVIGRDSVVINWLKEQKVKILPFKARNQSNRQVILIAGEAPDSTTMLSIASQMARGSVVIFLSPSTFKSGNNTTRWLPLVNKGRIADMDDVAGYYRAERWAKSHPVFDGMPSGGMMDYKYFRNIISKNALSQEYSIRGKGPHTFDEASSPLIYPTEVICGATRISHTYCSGVHVGVWDFGRGRFIVNTLHVGKNLGKDPAADRLFCNMLNYASRDINKPMEKLPVDFNRQLIEIRYTK